MLAITFLNRSEPNRLPVAGALLLALATAPAPAQVLALEGSTIPISGAGNQATNPAVALVNGTAAVTYHDGDDLFVLTIAESQDGTLALGSPQTVASDVSTASWVVPNPDSDADYLYRLFLQTNAGPIDTAIVDELGQPGAAMAAFSSDGSFGLDVLGGSSPGFAIVTRLGDEARLFYTTTTLESLFEATAPGHDFSEGFDVIRMFTGSSPGALVARGPATQPHVLITELANDTSTGSSIYGRFFDDSAGPIGGAFPIHPAFFDGFKLRMDLAASPSGIVMVVWEDLTVGRQPAFALVDSQGPIPGGSGYVSNTGFIEQSAPRVAAIGNCFVVTWRRRGVNGGSDTIHARFIDPSDPTAPLVGPEVEVSGSAAAGGRTHPAIATDERRDALVVWTETAPDLLTSEILGQRLWLDDLIFGDGFESGDVGAWSG